jgi:hypothetical protein
MKSVFEQLAVSPLGKTHMFNFDKHTGSACWMAQGIVDAATLQAEFGYNDRCVENWPS